MIPMHKQTPHIMLAKILERAHASEFSGNFICNTCHCQLEIDWFEMEFECMCED